MPQNKGHRKARNALKQTRYRTEERRRKNKIRDIKKQIYKYEKILLRNPRAKVQRNITDLEARLKEI